MNRLGHVGITLGIAAPLLAVCLLLGRPVWAALLAVTMVLSEPTPDIDTKLTRILPFVKHRGFTHSIFFIPIVAIAFSGVVTGVWLGVPLLNTIYPLEFEYIVVVGAGATVGTSSHFIGDIITTRGLRPFEPVSSQKIAAGWTTANNAGANAVLLATGLVLSTIAVAGPLYVTT
jgi:inner membrane protein